MNVLLGIICVIAGAILLVPWFTIIDIPKRLAEIITAITILASEVASLRATISKTEEKKQIINGGI